MKQRNTKQKDVIKKANNDINPYIKNRTMNIVKGKITIESMYDGSKSQGEAAIAASNLSK
mgnify:CR=1 FL=1